MCAELTGVNDVDTPRACVRGPRRHGGEPGGSKQPALLERAREPPREPGENHFERLRRGHPKKRRTAREDGGNPALARFL